MDAISEAMAVKPGNRTIVLELKVFPDETDVQAVPPWLGNPNTHLEDISFCNKP